VIPLGDGIANFEAGEHDVFRNVCDSVGPVEGVTVTHDGTRPFPDWHLSRVAVVDSDSGHKYIATCDK